MFDHQIVHPYPLTISHSPSYAVPSFPPPPNVHLPVDLPVQLGYEHTEKASVWGPTCDWIGWGEMGAYTLCAASTFNGFERSPVHWTTGGTTTDAIAVRAILDAFAGPQR
jgi:ornithine decarboxylase